MDVCVCYCVSLMGFFPHQEKMPIPSVVIEPASSNEGDDDRDVIDISPTTISDNGVTPDTQTAKDITTSDGPPGLPPGFLYKVFPGPHTLSNPLYSFFVSVSLSLLPTHTHKHPQDLPDSHYKADPNCTVLAR